MAETSTMPAATSLAILAFWCLSWVIKSTIASIEVLTISETRTILKVKIKTSHSKLLIESMKPTRQTQAMAKR